jgi:antitoxin component of RelBE/YafQ-DinJ toxin-antitoxin module
MTRRLNVRVSDGELEALHRASAEMGCSRSQVVRLLVHCLADSETRLGADTIAFDYETSHGIVRSLRSIGTLYNQSVAALDTIAKVARES